MWLIWQDRIPHRHLLAVREIVQDFDCPRCQDHTEHGAHIIREFVKSREIWRCPGMPVLLSGGLSSLDLWEYVIE